MEDFLQFLTDCPTPYHFISYARQELIKNGFVELKENENLSLVDNNVQNAFVVRDERAIVAFKLNAKQENSPSIMGICTNSDVPCFTLKYNYLQNLTGGKSEDETNQNSTYQIIRLFEYGNGLWHTYLDHDLKVAGCLLVRNHSTNQIERRLIDSKRGVMVIPNPARHHNYFTALSPSYDREKCFNALFSTTNKNNSKQSFKEYVLSLLNDASLSVDDIVDWDLQIIGSQDPSNIGNFIVASGLSNHANCYASLKAFLAQNSMTTEKVPVLAIFNNEEISGVCRTGVKCTLLDFVLDKIYKYLRPTSIPQQLSIKNRSLFVNVSSSHGANPNSQQTSYSNDPLNSAKLGDGPILRCSTRSAITTDMHGSAQIQTASEKGKIPLQVHIPSNKSSIASTQSMHLQFVSGIRSVDIASPILAKHSIREMMDWSDIENMEKLIEELYYDKSQNEKEISNDQQSEE